MVLEIRIAELAESHQNSSIFRYNPVHMTETSSEVAATISNPTELVDKARVASFSDNVISIALTLLVLDVRIPGPVADLTWGALRIQLVPRLMSFVLSFAIVGVYWVAHHIMFQALRSAGRTILWLNNLFLLTISLVPASAALLGAHSKSPIPTLLYGINIAAVGTSILVMWHYIVRRHRKLGIMINSQLIKQAYVRTITGICIAMTGAAVGFYRPAISYGIFWLAPVAFILVQTTTHPIGTGKTSS